MLFFLKIPNFPSFFCLLFKHIITVYGFCSFLWGFDDELGVVGVVDQVDHQMIGGESFERKTQAVFHIRESSDGSALDDDFVILNCRFIKIFKINFCTSWNCFGRDIMLVKNVFYRFGSTSVSEDQCFILEFFFMKKKSFFKTECISIVSRFFTIFN